MSDADPSDVLEVFAALADTLVDGYDVVELLQSLVEACERIADVDASGILLDAGDGRLEVIASSSESDPIVSLIELSAVNGPGGESFRTGQQVFAAQIAESPVRWERFRDQALALQFRSAVAIPMRLRDTVIGTLNILSMRPGELRPGDLRTMQALANVATIGILHERVLRESALLQEQLAHALESRTRIEQAKGVVSYQREVTPAEAFDLIRAHARANRSRISDVADAIVHRHLTL